MDTLDELLSYGLPPSNAFLPRVRQIFINEIERELSGKRQEGDVAFLCGAQLFASA